MSEQRPDGEFNHATPASQASAGGPFRAAFRNPWFIAVFCLMTTFTLGFEMIVQYYQINLQKKPLPLRASLEEMDKLKLRPYELLAPIQIQADVLNALGTKMYIQWMMKDGSKGDNLRPEDYITLFVTYYTGSPDQVPHVPEECYLGGGFQKKEDRLLEVPIPALGEDVRIPIHLLLFERESLMGREQRVVLYTFNVNGEFKAERNDVRFLLGNPLEQYAYFSKVELTFGLNQQLPKTEDAIASGERFLRKVIPILVRDHWPDWEHRAQSEADPS